MPEQRDSNDDLQREIRKERKFSLAEAIGRLAGPGAMKGASPVGRKQQAEAVIEIYLRQNLVGAGCLPVVLIRQIRGSSVQPEECEQPLRVLGNHLRRVLDSEYLLKELVREADVEWGRMYEERPFFETEGCAPHPQDPYTVASVRKQLLHLIEKLTASDADGAQH